MGFPWAAALIGGGLGLGALGSIFGAKGAKKRANEFQRIYDEQRDRNRLLFEDILGFGERAMNLANQQLKETGERAFDARGIAADQLNRAGQFMHDRIGLVNRGINQVGQTARQDILDESRRVAGQVERNLTQRGLGSSTMLAGARAQQNAATGRNLSALGESVAGLRGAATERTTGDLGDFMRFRIGVENKAMNDLVDFMKFRTALETSLLNERIPAIQQQQALESNLLSNLISAAAGGKGVAGITAGRMLGGLGSNLLELLPDLVKK